VRKAKNLVKENKSRVEFFRFQKKNCAQNFNSKKKLKKYIGKCLTSWLVVILHEETSSCKWTNLPSCDFSLKQCPKNFNALEETSRTQELNLPPCLFFLDGGD
jgi:hypothetical protein